MRNHEEKLRMMKGFNIRICNEVELVFVSSLVNSESVPDDLRDAWMRIGRVPEPITITVIRLIAILSVIIIKIIARDIFSP